MRVENHTKTRVFAQKPWLEMLLKNSISRSDPYDVHQTHIITSSFPREKPGTCDQSFSQFSVSYWVLRQIAGLGLCKLQVFFFKYRLWRVENQSIPNLKKKHFLSELFAFYCFYRDCLTRWFGFFPLRPLSIQTDNFSYGCRIHANWHSEQFSRLFSSEQHVNKLGYGYICNLTPCLRIADEEL